MLFRSVPSHDRSGSGILMSYGASYGSEVNPVAQYVNWGPITASAAHREALIEHFKKHEAELDEDAKRRLHTNPLRILDSKISFYAPPVTDVSVVTTVLAIKTIKIPKTAWVTFWPPSCFPSAK